jgi:hypothetical protein
MTRFPSVVHRDMDIWMARVALVHLVCPRLFLHQIRCRGVLIESLTVLSIPRGQSVQIGGFISVVMLMSGLMFVFID